MELEQRRVGREGMKSQKYPLQVLSVNLKYGDYGKK